MFIKVKIEYAENLDLNKNYLYMPNHVSLLDAPLMVVYLPQFVNALEAKEHFSWPLYGKLIRMWGNIPIDRKNARSSYTSMMKSKTVLQERNSIIIYPEGGRTTDGEDTYSDDAAFIQLGIHYQVDVYGSRQELIK